MRLLKLFHVNSGKIPSDNSDGIFSIAEEKRNRIKSGQTNDCENDATDDLEIRAKNTGNKIVLEKSNQAPVDCADNNEREN